MKVGDLWEVEFTIRMTYRIDEESGVLVAHDNAITVHIGRIEEIILPSENEIGNYVIHNRSYGYTDTIYPTGITKSSKERLLRYMAKHYRIENR